MLSLNGFWAVLLDPPNNFVLQQPRTSLPSFHSVLNSENARSVRHSPVVFTVALQIQHFGPRRSFCLACFLHQFIPKFCFSRFRAIQRYLGLVSRRHHATKVEVRFSKVQQIEELVRFTRAIGQQLPPRRSKPTTCRSTARVFRQARSYISRLICNWVCIYWPQQACQLHLR